jgi:hypothetical protein
MTAFNRLSSLISSSAYNLLWSPLPADRDIKQTTNCEEATLTVLGK